MDDDARSSNYQDVSRIVKKTTTTTQRVKPRFYKLMGQIMNFHIEPILNYLEMPDLCKTRSINKLFLAIVHEYYPKRLRFEVDKIKVFQERNYDNFLNFMKIIDSQIPISNRNWLDFDLTSVINKLKVLDKKVITNLRSIKSIGKLSEAVFAPFCIIFGYNKNSYSMIKNEGWKKVFGKIVSDPDLMRKMASLDMDNLNETDMLDSFVYLNLPEVDIDNIRKYSPDLEKLVIWCQAVLSYHVLIHPFTYRNEKSNVQPGSDLHTFVILMNRMLDRFYKFKRFLINLNIMNIPLAEYVFNLQHNREKPQESESLGKYLDEKNIASILSYLPYNSSFKLMGVSKKWKEGFKLGIDLVIHEILKEIFYLKLQASEKLYKRIPILFEINIFSQYFLMIDDILNGEGPFLSKEQLNDIKNIKIESEVVKSVSKVICLILNEKTDRKISHNGEIKNLCLEKLKSLVLSGNLTKLMKNCNKLDINTTKLNQITEELQNYLTVEKLDEIKRINRGVYQLLIWELLVYELHKTYNPFDFISNDFIINRFEKEEVDIIKYYCEVMNYLKYNLKIKFKISHVKGFEFKKLFEDLRNFLSSQKMSMETNFENSQEYAKISNVFFETKELIPSGARPAFYERMFNEIMKLNTRQLKQNQENVNEVSGIYKEGNSQIGNNNNLGTIKEENSIHGDRESSNKKEREIINLNNNLSNNNNKQEVYQLELNKIQLLSHLNRNTKKKSLVTFNDIPGELVIKHMLFFLDINSLPKFSMASKKANECVKTHIFIRLYFLNKEKKLIEQENMNIITNVEESRKQFYEEYEIEAPSKEHACQLMNLISSNDIMELKQVFKKYNKNYETIISPLVLLLGGKAQSTINPDGTKTTTYFYPAQKILNSKDFIGKLRELELETIPHNRFKSVEKVIEGPNFNIDKIRQLSPCLHHLLSWVIGVIEFHRVIRKYSLSSYDYDILSEEELTFCNEMDNILVLYYKLLRYANTYCKKFEKNAQNIMTSMNIILGEKKI